MKKFIVIIAVVIIIGVGISSLAVRRDYGYRHEGLISTFTHSAVRGAGSYVGYRAAKHAINGLSGHHHHRECRHHYSCY